MFGHGWCAQEVFKSGVAKFACIVTRSKAMPVNGLWGFFFFILNVHFNHILLTILATGCRTGVELGGASNTNCEHFRLKGRPARLLCANVWERNAWLRADRHQQINENGSRASSGACFPFEIRTEPLVSVLDPSLGFSWLFLRSPPLELSCQRWHSSGLGGGRLHQRADKRCLV